MKEVGDMLNQRIEPTWVTNTKFPVLRPEPHKTLDANVANLSPDTMSSKSFYKPR